MTFHEPLCPTLAELLVMDQDDEIFLRHLYRQLLGREPDPMGLRAHRARLPKSGRLFILAVILCSEESRHYRAALDLRLPPEAKLAMRIPPLLKLGAPGKLLLKPVILGLRLWERGKRDALCLQSRCLRAEMLLDRQDEQIVALLSDVDSQLSQIEVFLSEQSDNIAAVQHLRGRILEVIHHGLPSEDPLVDVQVQEFDGRGQHQQRLLEELELRWSRTP